MLLSHCAKIYTIPSTNTLKISSPSNHILASSSPNHLLADNPTPLNLDDFIYGPPFFIMQAFSTQKEKAVNYNAVVQHKVRTAAIILCFIFRWSYNIKILS